MAYSSILKFLWKCSVVCPTKSTCLSVLAVTPRPGRHNYPLTGTLGKLWIVY